MTPHLELVRFYGAEQVAALFGQIRNGTPDTRWVYRHAAKHGFLHAASRHHPGTRTLFFDRGEIDRILSQFSAPDST